MSAIRLLDHVSFLVSVSGSTFPVAQTAGHRRIPHFSCRGECFGSVKVPGTRIQRDLLERMVPLEEQQFVPDSTFPVAQTAGHRIPGTQIQRDLLERMVPVKEQQFVPGGLPYGTHGAIVGPGIRIFRDLLRRMVSLKEEQQGFLVSLKEERQGFPEPGLKDIYCGDHEELLRRSS